MMSIQKPLVMLGCGIALVSGASNAQPSSGAKIPIAEEYSVSPNSFPRTCRRIWEQVAPGKAPQVLRRRCYGSRR